jgi:hypothetical protein
MKPIMTREMLETLKNRRARETETTATLPRVEAGDGSLDRVGRPLRVTASGQPTRKQPCRGCGALITRGVWRGNMGFCNYCA